MRYVYDASDRTQRKHVRKYSVFRLIVSYLIVLAIAITAMLLLSCVSTMDGDRATLVWHGLFATTLIVTTFSLLIGLVTVPLAGGRSIRTELNDDHLIITETGFGFRRQTTIRYDDIDNVAPERLSETSLWRRMDGTLFIRIKCTANTVDGKHNTYQKPRAITIAAVSSAQEADTLIQYILHANRRSS